MAVLDNLLQLFAQRDMRRAVAGQRTGAEAMQPQAPQAPSIMSILGPQADPRRAAAVGAGQGLLANTPGTEGLAGAIGGARDAIAEVMAARKQAAMEAQAMALKAEQDAARRSVLTKYIGKDDLDSIQGLTAELVSLGDDQSLKMAEHLKPLLESLKVDKDRATVEGDSAFKTALSEFAVSKYGQLPQDLHQMPLTPAEAMQVNARADTIRKMGASSTNVSLNTPTPERTLGPEITQQLAAERKDAQSALSVISATNDAERLLKSGIFTGKGAPAITEIAAAAQALGLLDNAGTDKLSATQEYLSLISTMVLDEYREAGSGAMRGLTDDERRWVLKAKGGNIAYTSPALLSIARKLNAKARQKVGNYQDRYVRITRGLSPDQQEYFRLPDVEEALRPTNRLREGLTLPGRKP